MSLPHGQFTPIELADAVGDSLQETSVVGNEHDRTVKCFKLLLKPGDGGDVEVVGGLIKQ